MRRPLVLRVWIPKPHDEPHKSVSTRRTNDRRKMELLLFLALVALLGLALGFAFLAFLALFFFLALLDEFGLGWRCGFGGHRLRRLLFFVPSRRHQARE